jgi:MFS family permease
MSACFGLGFIAGPVIGGGLAIWVRAPFLAAAVLNGLNFLVALLVLPESHKGQRAARSRSPASIPLGPLRWAFRLSGSGCRCWPTFRDPGRGRRRRRHGLGAVRRRQVRAGVEPRR